MSRFGIVKFFAISAAASVMMESHSLAALRCDAVLLSSSHIAPDSLRTRIANLAALRMELDLLQVDGEVPASMSLVKREYLLREADLLDFVRVNELMSVSEYKELVRAEIARLQKLAHEAHEKEQEERRVQSVVKEAVALSRKITFHTIPSGILRPSALTEVKIDSAFQLMDTAVTQIEWAQLLFLMGERDASKLSPSALKRGGPDARVITLGGVSVPLLPDYPVTSLTESGVLQFFEKLNQLSQSTSRSVQRDLEFLLPGHKAGDVYSLPTKHEMAYVMTNLGLPNVKWFDRDDFTELGDYAWIKTNSNGRPHAVGTKLPRLINGEPFYDLEGNVAEIVIGDSREGLILKGGSFLDKEWIAQAWSVSAFEGNSSRTGFRIIRRR